MTELDLLSLSRLQFALTALYHFLFVPLTIGLSLLIAIMESVYVMTGRTAWRDLAKFWGVLFGINFAMGVATGITMEFQFGTNWAYYAHYVGDIFGAPLAIEGLMAFFLEGTFVGLFFFGWNRLSRVGHLAVTWLVSIGSNLSALWILVANGWMQNPVGAVFNPDTMRMELTSFREVLLNPVAQSKYVHTIAASYVTGAVFVLAVSAFYLLKQRHREFARRSMSVAASFGLAAAISVVALGDESGYTATHNQKMKLAAMEAEWETQPAPAGFNLFAVPDTAAHANRYEVKIPWLLGLIATRRVDQEVPGILDLVDRARSRIHSGHRNELAALRVVLVEVPEGVLHEVHDEEPLRALDGPLGPDLRDPAEIPVQEDRRREVEGPLARGAVEVLDLGGHRLEVVVQRGPVGDRGRLLQVGQPHVLEGQQDDQGRHHRGERDGERMPLEKRAEPSHGRDPPGNIQQLLPLHGWKRRALLHLVDN